MVGQLQFYPGARGRVEEERLYGLPVIRVRVDPDGWLGPRRLDRAGRRLAGRGAVRTLLPQGFEDGCWLARSGLRRVDPAPFLQAQSHALALEALRRQDRDPERAAVALCADRADRAMAQAAARLCRRVRHLVIDAPRGGDRLAHWLRWEFGVAVLPVGEEAQVTLKFQPVDVAVPGQPLELYGHRPELGGIRPTVPALLEQEREDLELITLLWEWRKLGEDDLKFT